MHIERFIKENNEYEFELQKFLDIASNIKDEELRLRVMTQMIKCQEKLAEILENKE